MAIPSDNRVPLTGNPLIDGLTQGSAWTFSGPHVLTYSFSLDDVAATRVQWTAAWKSAFAQAASEWSNVANVSFTEAGSGGIFTQSSANIAVALTSDDGGIGLTGFGIFPSPQFGNLLLSDSDYNRTTYPHPEGDILYVATSPAFDSLDPGQVGFESILHEIGHALGLKHPFDDGLNGRPTFAQLGMSDLDNDMHTVMSYSGIQSAMVGGFAATPMPLDILAIQQIYGPNMSYHGGDDTYALKADPVMRTIWDAGGTDTLDASALPEGSVIDLRPGHFSFAGSTYSWNTGALGVAYNVTIERAIGSDWQDLIYGNDAANFIDGRGGPDSMFGGPGNDTYILDNIADSVWESEGEGTDSVYVGWTYTLPPNIEQLVLTGNGNIDGKGNEQDNQITGTIGNNYLVGYDGDDRLLGDAGNDILDGGPGNDWLEGGAGIDAMRGGTGNDIYVLDGSDGPVPLAPYSLLLVGEPGEWISQGQILAFSNATGTFTVSQLSDLTGDGLVDYLLIQYAEPGLTHFFYATFGTNQLGTNLSAGTYLGAERATSTSVGHPGLDIAGDGQGADQIFGSFTIRSIQIDYSSGSPVLVSFSASFEQHAESPTAPAMTGEIHYNDPGGVLEPIEELPNQGIDTIYTPLTYALTDNFENLTLTGTGNVDGTGTDTDNVLIGNDGSNHLIGLLGNDTLDGGAGDDVLEGGAGDDIYGVDSTADVLVEAANGGTDTVRASITFALAPNFENLVLIGANDIDGTGTAGTNTLTGNVGANHLTGGGGDDFLDGDAGNDVLDGGTGADHMSGGAGNDLFIVDSGLDVLDDSSGVDTIQSSVSILLQIGFENLILTGSDNINGVGNAADNHIQGNSGANLLSGGAGRDQILGGAGDDVLDGGTGDDSMSGEGGNDTYQVDSLGDSLFEAANAGIDSVFSSVSLMLGANFENLTLTGSANLNASGNELDNTLVGNAGSNLLDGGLGNDTMIGGAGDDRYIVDSPGDVVVEQSGGGFDSVSTGASWQLSAYVENASLTGSTASFLTGNEQRNALAGNSGSNVLDGGRGADGMAGGPGDDTYRVDNGLDQVTELAGQGSDTIISQVPRTLAANVENLTLGDAAGNIEGIGNAANNIIVGNNTANLLDGGAGNDQLKGQGGDDTLLGGAGDDTLSGGAGRDVLSGGAGADHFVFDAAVASGTNIDQVLDLVHGQDVIDLSVAIFGAAGVPGNLAASAFVSEPEAVAHDANQHIVHDTSTGTLYYDVDGSGVQQMVAFAHINAGQALAASDFHMVS